MYTELRLKSATGPVVHKTDSPTVPREKEYVYVDDTKKLYQVAYVVYCTQGHGGWSVIAVVTQENSDNRPLYN